MIKKNDLNCPVCDKYSFQKKKDYDICPYCGWENDGFYEEGGANGLSLKDYKKRYNQYIETYPDFVWSKDGYSEISEED